MINRNKFSRIHSVIQRCQEGSVVQPATDVVKRAYAKQKGLVFENGEFFHVDNATGEKTVVNVTDADLADLNNSESEKAATLNMVSKGVSSINALLQGTSGVQNQSGTTQAINTGIDTIADQVQNPYVKMGMKAAVMGSNAMAAAGIATDGQTGFDRVADSAILKMTPVGIINAVGAKKTQDFSADDDTISKVGGSYGGTVSEINDAAEKTNKSYGLFSSGARKKANRAIDEARRKQNLMSDIAQETTDQHELVNMMGDLATKAYRTQISGGFDARYFRAKSGGVLAKVIEDKAEWVPELIDIIPEKIIPTALAEGGTIGEKINPVSWQPEFIEIDSFKEGGKVEKQLDAPEIEGTNQKNIIPEGALHKNKHHMENAEDLTKKGIPVVDDGHTQQAEIECNEIIFTKEVTQKLEELYKVFYSEDSTNKEKEQASLDAGKLLTKEIMLNTDDRTGLIDTLQKGGTLDLKKPDYKTWLASVNKDFLSDLYDLDYAYEVLPLEVLEKWRKETLKDKPSDSTDWHLPSVHQLDDDTIIFLKRGRTTKDNPELQGEFEFYTSTPEFSKEWRMQFNKDENRWYYKKRNKAASK